MARSFPASATFCSPCSQAAEPNSKPRVAGRGFGEGQAPARTPPAPASPWRRPPRRCRRGQAGSWRRRDRSTGDRDRRQRTVRPAGGTQQRTAPSSCECRRRASPRRPAPHDGGRPRYPRCRPRPGRSDSRGGDCVRRGTGPTARRHRPPPPTRGDPRPRAARPTGGRGPRTGSHTRAACVERTRPPLRGRVGHRTPRRSSRWLGRWRPSLAGAERESKIPTAPAACARPAWPASPRHPGRPLPDRPAATTTRSRALRRRRPAPALRSPARRSPTGARPRTSQLCPGGAHRILAACEFKSASPAPRTISSSSSSAP